LDTSNVRDKLQRRIPALNSSSAADREIWTEQPPDNDAIFGEILRPHLFNLLRTSGNEVELQDIFRFLEEVANAGSVALSDVLQIEIVTPLARNKIERESAQSYMGNALGKQIKASQKWSFRLWLAS
jgi:hypothetical protein